MLLKRRPYGSEVVRRALAPVVDALVRADPNLRANCEPERVHDARVATRKLRSSLEIYAPLLGERWTVETRASLKRLGALLGAVRDADVLGAHVAALGESMKGENATAIAGVAVSAGAARDTAYAALRTALRERWYLALLDGLVAAVHDGPPLARADRALRPHGFVARTMRRSWKRLHRAASRLRNDEASLPELHALRRLTKRSRYAADALAPLLHGRRARKRCRFVKRLARLQDRLGAIHDIALECGVLRADAGPDRTVRVQLADLETARGAGLLPECLTLWQAAARRRFRFWR